MRTIGNKTAGFSLMEMLVSIVIGMIIVAAASTMLVNILKAQKDIASSAGLNQELGAVMAVMSNEIRRSGFGSCKNTDCSSVSYALGEDVKIGDGGKCIEFRYNANLDEDGDTPGEHRGFRLKDNNRIQMAGSANVACGNDANWVDLTDPDVMNITGLSFSTIGSKCRNLQDGTNDYWYIDSDVTYFPCRDPEDTSPPTLNVKLCNDINSDGLIDDASECSSVVAPTLTSGEPFQLFETRQVNIRLIAELVKDGSVKKNLTTAVKVENPRIRKGIAP